MNDFIEQLKEKRASWVKINKENDFEDGITSLLTELYPDNAHFIYELLQNAEDAEAKKVSFELKTNELIFVHNGKKLFCESDIEAITNIGKGTKKDDVNKIGKFGVGFKSVFSYTKSPSIYSGDYNFIITDLVVPNTIEPVDKESNETVFKFPFNNSLKKEHQAYSEIIEGLININRTTLLFLNSISEIEIKLSDESYTIRKETNSDNKITKITNTKLNKETKFLVFSKKLPEEEKLYVSIGFRLTQKGKIAVNNEAKVSIFFPAEKETSNLKFHIHAPFASTVARDSITDREENNKLIDLIADLLCEATEWIKKQKLLDDNFIGCLPIDDDNLSDFYKPIQSKIIDLFNTKPFLLCDDNEYHPAKDCWQSTKRLKAVISTADLKTLLKGKINNDCFWTTRPFQRNASGRVNNFLKSLELNTYSENDFEKQMLEMGEYFTENPYIIKEELRNWWENNRWYNNNEELKSFINNLLISKLNDKELVIKLYFLLKEKIARRYNFYYIEKIKTIINSNYYTYVLIDFLTNKSNEWLKGLYEFLYNIINIDDDYDYDYESYDSEYQDLRVFVKLNNERFNFSKSDCYFPSKTNIASIENLIISTAIYDDNQGNKKESKSKKFLKTILGVKEISIEDEVKHILNKYKEDKKINYEDNIIHVKLFLKFFKENKSNFNKEPFENSSFLINSDNEFTKPAFILIDSPIEQTALARLANEKYKLPHTLYTEAEQNISLENFKDFLVAVGAKNSLPIEKNKLTWQKINELREGRKESDYCINENFRIPFSLPFESPKIETSLVIWNSISKLESLNIFDARYRANKTQEINICDSDVIQILKNSCWIPNIDGVFYKPEDITTDNLHNDFIYSNRNGWLDRIDFGQNTIKNQKLEGVKNELKEHTGYSLKTLEKANKAGISEERLNQFIEREEQKKLNLESAINKHNRNIDSNKSQLNQSIVSDSEEYREKAQQQLLWNVLRSAEKRQSYNYSKKVKIGISETLAFLKKQYQGHCQICGFTFPQSGKNGNYFEMFDWLSEKISNQKSNIIEAGTALCLCSRCHSILKHGDFEAKFLDSIQNIDNIDYSEFAERFDLILESEEVPEDFGFIEMDMYKLPIRKLNTDEHIFFSEEHFIHFYSALTLNDYIQEEEKKEQDIEILNNAKRKAPEIEPKRVVKIGDIVTLNYSNKDIPVKIKLVSTGQNGKDSNGINLISASNPIGQKITGKLEGYIFEMGQNMVEIIKIE